MTSRPSVAPVNQPIGIDGIKGLGYNDIKRWRCLMPIYFDAKKSPRYDSSEQSVLIEQSNNQWNNRANKQLLINHMTIQQPTKQSNKQLKHRSNNQTIIQTISCQSSRTTWQRAVNRRSITDSFCIITLFNQINQCKSAESCPVIMESIFINHDHDTNQAEIEFFQTCLLSIERSISNSSNHEIIEPIESTNRYNQTISSQSVK